jgi:hypothetical protein
MARSGTDGSLAARECGTREGLPEETPSSWSLNLRGVASANSWTKLRVAESDA